MLKKNIVLGLLFCIFTVFPLNAANVSFLVMETGLRQGSPSARYSAMWENGLMETFFEFGHIVSNAPMLQLLEKPVDVFPSEAERDYEDAKRGGMDFFVIAIINYPATRANNNTKPQNVILRLFNTKSEKLIHEKTFSDIKTKTPKEEYDYIKNAVAEFAANLRRQ